MQVFAFNASPIRSAELFLSGENYFKRVVFVDQHIESIVIPIDFSSQSNDMDFSLKVPNAAAPFEVIYSEDKRIIGIALHKFKFSD
jgi:hypothetical protein